MNRMEAPKIFRLMKALAVTGGYRVFASGPNMASPRAFWRFSLIKVRGDGRVVYSAEVDEERPIELKFDDLRSRRKK